MPVDFTVTTRQDGECSIGIQSESSPPVFIVVSEEDLCAIVEIIKAARQSKGVSVTTEIGH